MSGLSMKYLIDVSSHILQFVLALAKFTRDSSDKLDDEASHKFIILGEGASIKLVDFFMAENAWIDVAGIHSSDLMDNGVGIGFEIDGRIEVGVIVIQERVKEGIDAVTIRKVLSGISFPRFGHKST
jgi:hypothetical protein